MRVRRASVGPGRAHLRCQDEDTQETAQGEVAAHLCGADGWPNHPAVPRAAAPSRCAEVSALNVSDRQQAAGSGPKGLFPRDRAGSAPGVAASPSRLRVTCEAGPRLCAVLRRPVAQSNELLGPAASCRPRPRPSAAEQLQRTDQLRTDSTRRT